MKRVFCVVALGLSVGACETYPGDYGYGYYGAPPGRFVREQKCFEVQPTPFSRPYIECRDVRRWKPDYASYKPRHRHNHRYRDRDDDDDIYSYREPKRRWRDKEYYD